MRKNIANIVTACRILGSVIMLFLPAYSIAFFITYISCGFTDMIDGTIARKTNSNSEFGAKIDTTADIVFLTVAMIKILPTINIPRFLWIWGSTIGIIKIGNIICGYSFKKQFFTVHSAMNKITGLLLFILPLTLSFIEQKYSIFAVCTIATFAASQEGVYIIKSSVTHIK